MRQKGDPTRAEGVSGDELQEMALTSGIIALSKALNLRTLAEGVERAEEAGELRALGCDAAQGYFFAKPIGARQMGDVLRTVRMQGIACGQKGEERGGEEQRKLAPAATYNIRFRQNRVATYGGDGEAECEATNSAMSGARQARCYGTTCSRSLSVPGPAMDSAEYQRNRVPRTDPRLSRVSSARPGETGRWVRTNRTCCCFFPHDCAIPSPLARLFSP